MGVDNKLTDVSKETDTSDIKYGTHIPGQYVSEPHDKEYLEMVLKGGNHSAMVKKILRQRVEARAKEFPRWPASQSGGVRIMWLESRFWYDRERLSPDFDADWRNYRAKYLQSLELDPREPVHIPEYEKALINPFRRLAMKPLDLVENKVIRLFNTNRYETQTIRRTLRMSFWAISSFMLLYYYSKYHHKRWYNNHGLLITSSQPAVYPDDPRWPMTCPITHPGQWSDQGFSKRNCYQDLRDFETTHYTL